MANNILILMVVCMCLICIYTDIKENIIYNKVLLCFACPALGIKILYEYLVNNNYSYKCIFIVLFSIMISLGLYKMGIWAGGDLKMYIAIILALPNRVISKEALGMGLWLYVLLIAFIIGYIFLIVDSIYNLFKIKKISKTFFDDTKGNVFAYIKYYLVISFLTPVIAELLPESINIVYASYIITIVNICTLFMLIRYKICDSKSFMITILIANMIIISVSEYHIITRRNMLFWIIIVFSYSLKNFVNEYNYKTIPIKNLKQGMILSTETSIVLVNTKRVKYNKLSDETLKSRLSKDDISSIEKSNYIEKGIDNVVIVRKIPFGSFISISTIIIIIMGYII